MMINPESTTQNRDDSGILESADQLKDSETHGFHEDLEVNIIYIMGEFAQHIDLERINALSPIASIYPNLAVQTGSNGHAEAAEPEPLVSTRIIYWYHPDYVGNVDLVTDLNQEAYEFYLYNPWGESLYHWESGSSSWNSPYRFNAKEFDSETGMHYYGARYHHPKLSVWMSVDPLAHKTMDVYGFTGNNPIMRIDPNGEHWVEGPDGKITWQDNVTSANDVDLKEGFIYRGPEYHRFTPIEGDDLQVNFESYHSDQSFTSTIESRPDADGIITSEEAQRWYAYGNGQPLVADVSLLKFKSSSLCVERDFTDNKSASVNFFNRFDIHPHKRNILYRPAMDENLSHVFGTVRVVLTNPSTGEIRLATDDINGSIDTYDFKYFEFIPKNNYRNGSYQKFLILPKNNRGTIRIEAPFIILPNDY